MANIVQLGKAVLNLAQSRGILSLEAAARELIPIIRIIWWLLEQSNWSSKIAKLFPLITPMDDTEAITELNRDLDEAKKQQKKNDADDNKVVIKVKDAMAAVHDSIGVGAELVAFLKQLVQVIAKGSGGSVTILQEKIRQKMLESALRQDRPRVKKDRAGFFRPGARKLAGKQ